MQARAHNADEAVDFLSAVFGATFPSGAAVLLFGLGTRNSRDLIHAPAEAAPIVARANEDGRDLYVAVAYQAANVRHIGSKRNSAADAVGLPALWLDIDVKDGGARDHAHACEIAALLAPPTVVVATGGTGSVHAWWRFEEPWIFTGEERERAGLLTRGWQQAHRDLSGVHLDSTHDLARVLRLPGTFNQKVTPAVPVRLVTSTDDAVSRETAEEHAAAQGAVLRVSAKRVSDVRAGLVFGSGRAPDPNLWSALALNDGGELQAIFQHRRKVPGRQADQSDSAVEFYLGSVVHRAGWEAQDVLDLMVWHRRASGNAKGKLEREDYFAATLARVLGGEVSPLAISELDQREETVRAEVDERHRESREATLDLQGADSFSMGAPEVLRRFNAIVACGRDGAPQVVAVEQYSESLESTIYRLRLGDGRMLDVPARDLLDPRKFRFHLMTKTRHVMTRLPRGEDWAAVVQVLLEVVAVHRVEEASATGVVLGAVQSIVDRFGVADDLSDDPLQGGRPFLRDGRVWIPGTLLKEAIKGQPGSVPNLGTQLNVEFGAPERFNLPRRADGKRGRTPLCYGVPLETLGETPP